MFQWYTNVVILRNKFDRKRNFASYHSAEVIIGTDAALRECHASYERTLYRPRRVVDGAVVGLLWSSQSTYVKATMN